MKTIKAIKLLLEEYKQHVERIVARSKTDYDKQVKIAQAETMGWKSCSRTSSDGLK